MKEKVKLMSRRLTSGYIPVTIALVMLLLFVTPVMADEWVGGIPLETVQTGTVTGDLWFDVDPAPNWGLKDVTKTFTLPAAAVEEEGRITWARLYVSAYCGHMQDNRAFTITNRFDGDGDGEYERVWPETARSAFKYIEEGGNDNTALGGGPNDPYKMLNDHENRVTSDYFMWYDVTSLIKNQTVNVNVNTGDSFDGRIKVISLVVAYDNPSSTTETTYWVNQGHDVCSYYVEDNFGEAALGTTAFNTSGLPEFDSARLTVSYMASNNGNYGFPTAENDFTYTGGTPPIEGTFTDALDRTPDIQGPYSGVISWDVTGKVAGKDEVTLAYSRDFTGTGTSAFYKVPLAFLVVTDEGSAPTEPVLTTIEVTPETADVAVGATRQFAATAKDQNGNGMTNVTFAWTSSNETVGTVDATGLFTALAAGSTTVTASAESVTGTAAVMVTGAGKNIDLTIGGMVNTVFASAVFCNVPNEVVIRNIKNAGTDTAENITVAVYDDAISTTVPVATTTIPTIAGGKTVLMTKLVDPTLRKHEGGTVTYRAVLDPDNLIPETNESNNEKSSFPKPLKYNGYMGAQYWTGKEEIKTYRTYDLRGNITHSFGNSSYRSGSFGSGWTEYAVGWTAENLTIPDGATLREARLYVPYCWDNSDEARNVTITFNGAVIPVERDPWEVDQSNFGAYDNHWYGLMTYNVTDGFAVNEENTAVVSRINSNAKLSPAGLTLAVVYEDPLETRKQIFINEGFDLLGADPGGYGTTEEQATSYQEFTGMTIDMANADNAMLTTFVPWGAAQNVGEPGEGNLFVNGIQLGHDVWNYGERMVGESDDPQVAVDTRDVLAYLNPNGTGNVIAIQSTQGSTPCMVAERAFLVVEYADAALPDLVVSTLTPNNGEVFSAAENTYTATITNIGTADAGNFTVEFNVTGATGTVTVDGLAAGANTTVAWTDETVRTAGDPVTVTVTADADGAIAEADEENNVRTVEKTVVNNGYRGKRWTGGDDLETAATYTVRGDLVYSSGSSTYLSASTGWTDDTVTWTAGDLAVPEGAAITAARLYVPYTWDKGPVFPANVTLTFNGETVDQAAFYEDEKMWGTSYPYGMTVYDVTGAFGTGGNTAVLANTYPGGGNVSVRGMLLAVVYDDGVTAPHTILMNEGFDLLYGGAAQSTTPEQATAYAPFTLENPSDAVGARLVTVAPGAGPTEGDLLFNDERFENVWNYTGTTQIGLDDRDVTAYLAGENLAGFRSDADWMEAAAAFLVVEYPIPTGSIAITSTPEGAAVWLDGTDTGLVTGCTLPDVPAGDHVVTLKHDGYADASTPVTVTEGETATVDITLTTATGSIAITSTPAGATILIDGADTGAVTNATLDGIAVGTHTVTLRKDGYVDATAEVTIEYNATATLHLNLARAIGSIAVTSAPGGAAIFLDGTETGEVTNATLTVPAGEHTVTVTKPGYADASATVTVGHDQTVPVHFALTEVTGSIRVTSTPEGAAVFLDGTETGEVTNVTLTVPAGDHVVRVELDGYQAMAKTVTVTAGETAEAAFALEAPVITLAPGWNFISTPKRLADGANTIAIFDAVETAGHSILLYDGLNCRWETMASEDAFRPLDGVWIYANTSYTIPLAFAAGAPELPPAKDLGKGWNAIGFSDTVPESAKVTLQSLGDHWSTLIGFDAGAQEYEISIARGATGRHGDERPMQPMQGYWLYMNTAETLGSLSG